MTHALISTPLRLSLTSSACCKLSTKGSQPLVSCPVRPLSDFLNRQKFDQNTLKNVKNCLNDKMTFYTVTSGGQHFEVDLNAHFFNAT